MATTRGKPPPPPTDTLTPRVEALEALTAEQQQEIDALTLRVEALEDATELPPEPPIDPGEPPVVTAGLSVTLTFAARRARGQRRGATSRTVVTFDMTDGVDMGIYDAPSGAFSQECIRVRHVAMPHFFVDFRPDTDSDRVEVVFWNGECFGDVPSGHYKDWPGYTAAIYRDGALLHTEEVPKHSWGTRWRWFSERRPLIRDAAAVFADGFLPRMSREAGRIDGYSGVIVPPVPIVVPPYTTFRGPDIDRTDFKCGIQRAIDGGGERQEIGLVTEWQGDWLLRGTQSSLEAMFHQAEMFGGDIDFYIPDQMTGAAVDYKCDDDHYGSYTLGREYGPYYRIVHREPVNDWYLHEASSHLPSLFLVPYALTEDPYYIEGQQFMCQWTLGWDIYGRENRYGHLGERVVSGYTGEIRTFGWDIRNIAAAYLMSPDAPPRWLQPKSYFRAVSDDMLMVSEQLWINDPRPRYRTFRLLSDDGYWQIFMQSYAIMGMALADLAGLPGWAEQAGWYFGFFRGVLGGDSGWENQVPQPHDILSTDMDRHTDWASAMADPAIGQLMKVYASFPDAPSPGNRQGGSMGNCSQIFAACACAQSRGIPDADKLQAWMDEFIDHNYPNNADASMGISFYAKCGFDGT